MRSWKLFTILGLIAVGALTWGAWFFVTSGDPNAKRLARLTTGIESIHWLEHVWLVREHTTSATEDIEAFVSALTAANQESTEAAGPRSLLLLDAYHRLLVTYFDGQRREEIVIVGTGMWFYYDRKAYETVDFEGDALEAFIGRMEAASQSPADNG